MSAEASGCALPPLVPGGGAIDPKTWWSELRDHWASRLQDEMYGRLPAPLPIVEVEDLQASQPVHGGLGERRVARVRFASAFGATVLLWVPRRPRPAPALIGLNLFGNHTTCTDADVPLPLGWTQDSMARGMHAHRWDIAQAMEAGIAVATCHLGDAHPDSPNPAIIDAHPGLGRPFGRRIHAERGPLEWGAISAWAWLLQRLVLAMARVDGIDPSRIGVIGHSRLGKAALLAAATEPTIALCIDNQSGTCGGSPSRKTPDAADAETTAQIARRFPHWFCREFGEMAATPERLSFDQHHLLALIAPRPVLMTYALGDRWADPNGSFRCAGHAAPVWEAQGCRVALPDVPPAPGHIVGGRLAWHLRAGGHDVLPEDWTTWLRWCASPDGGRL